MTHHYLTTRWLGIAMLVMIAFVSCKEKDTAPPKIDSAFSEYISAFTAGVVSRDASVRILLAEDYQGEKKIGEPIKETLFKFDPPIKGTATWVDDRTIDFKPEELLPYGTIYRTEFYLSKLKAVPSNLETFNFQFQTLVLNFDVAMGKVRSIDPKQMNWMTLTGQVNTSDVVPNAKVEEMVEATQQGTKLRLTWNHDANGRLHIFTVDSISRGEQESSVLLNWSGKPIDIDDKGTEQLRIPSLKDFSLMHFFVVQQPEQYISLQFSDPLHETQEFKGLVKLGNSSNLKFTQDANELRVYPKSRQYGTKDMVVYQGLKNILGYKLQEEVNLNVSFEELKPELKISMGDGVILPNSDGLYFPFEAVNLKAVDVTIIKIYEKNVGQYLQVNELGGNRELKRVGRPVLRKTVRLDDKGKDLGRWNSFSLDMNTLFKSEPGAIYQVQLGFRRPHSLYTCPGDTAANANLQDFDNSWEESAEDDDYWDVAESYYYDYDYYYDDYEDEYYNDGDYDYRERENPCNPAYYGSRRTAQRFVLASDLGIIAKSDANREFNIAVTNLVSTNPMAGVTVELYNYQNQLLGSTQTNADGLAKIKPNGKPFLLIAKSGSQRGYLRLDDGASLSLSKFDVSGEVVQKGVKGYIYGERGVWRPGDSIYVTFILEDKNKALPKDHPVTFELMDPQGQLIQRNVRNSGLNGVYDFRTNTDTEAPTGNWTARVKVGGSVFSKTLKIETVKPNRLKILIDFGKEALSVMDKNMEGSLKVTWLHGAVARNLRANIKVTLSQINTTFEKYKDYEFDDPSRSFSSDEQTMFEGKVNENGEATITANFDATGTAPGKLRANFVSRIFEESGDFSIDRFGVDYAPYKSFVGVKVPEGSKWRHILYTDTTNKVDVVTVDANGKPINRDSLEVSLYKLDWRWWWESGGSISRYSSSTTTDRKDFKYIKTSNGKGSYSFKVRNGDWGRYLLKVCDPVSGHCTGKVMYVDWPGWASRSPSQNPAGASMLVFATNKDKYLVGDEVEVNFPSSGVGRALVSIESGSKVIETYWVEAGKGETKFKFKATPGMAPNVYVHITLIQPHAHTANDLPIRMYGVIPLFVEDPNTRIKPVVEMPKVLEPETEFTLKVKEEKGQKMTYTIAVVDEGLLDLTRFKTPDPWPVFYAREALGVKTWDMYDHIIGVFGGKLNTLLSLGGDGEISKKGSNTAQRFKPMVRFLGPFELKPGEIASHKIAVPNYIGSVRTMVVASQNGAYGNTEVTTPVRKPLMVLATLPRVVGPGEKVKLPVTVFAMEKDVKTVKVEVKPNELLKLAETGTKTITFDAIGDQIVDFDIDIAEKLGIGKVQVIVTSGKHKATYEIELNVRNPNPPVTTFKDIALEPGQTWDTDYTPVGMIGTNKGTLELSGMPPIDLAGRLKYLIMYPHGCIEQTTSSAFPQLFLADLITLTEQQKFEVSDNIRTALNRLRSFQMHDGGFSYWPGGSYSSDWATTYAGHFILEAEAKGYTAPIGLKDNWITYQANKARNWTGHKSSSHYWNETDYTQAYRLYTLALAKKPEMGAMNRLRERPDISVEARWRLAAAYVLAGQPEAAKQLVSAGNVSPEKHNRNWYYYNYGSIERDEAMILETAVLLGDNTRGFKLLQNLSKSLNGKQWMSTQTTAYCLIAVSKYAGKYAKQGGFTYSYSINGSAPKKVTGNKPLSQYNIAIKNKDNGKVKVVNEGDAILYARVVLEGTPLTGQEKSFENNIVMKVTYKTLDGTTIDPSRLEQGTDFMAEVTIRNPDPVQMYKDMALSQIFPSGWEIHNTRMDGFDNVHTADKPDYEDIRDDRVYSYFNIWPQKEVTFRVLLNAAYQGEYYLSGPYCEAMYDNSVSSAKAGKWVKVVKAGTL